jgi:hypothetical protein
LLDWSEDMALKLVDLLFIQCPTTYEVRHLVTLLKLSQLTAKYDQVVQTIKMLESVNMISEIDFRASSKEVTAKLLERQLFEVAKSYAISLNLDPTEIVLRQAETLVDAAAHKETWQNEKERMACYN